MFGLQILDLVIGLIFIYFILSLVSSTIQEIFSNIFSFRYKHLKEWVTTTFKEQDLGKLLLSHKMIEGLTKSSKPSYIPSDIFTNAILDTINYAVHKDKPFDINSLKEALEKTDLLPAQMKRFVLQSIQEANGQLSKVRKDIENWYNDAMDRVGGAYKKGVQRWIMVISIVVVTGFNADSLQLTKYLYDHPTVSKSLADQAAAAVNDPEFKKRLEEIQYDTTSSDASRETKEIVAAIKTDISRIDSLSTKLSEMQLPIGWAKESLPCGFKQWFLKIVGILISALAVSLGAPFWFETLNKLVNLRNAGKKPEPKKQE